MDPATPISSTSNHKGLLLQKAQKAFGSDFSSYIVLKTLPDNVSGLFQTEIKVSFKDTRRIYKGDYYKQIKAAEQSASKIALIDEEMLDLMKNFKFLSCEHLDITNSGNIMN